MCVPVLIRMAVHSSLNTKLTVQDSWYLFFNKVKKLYLRFIFKITYNSKHGLYQYIIEDFKRGIYFLKYLSSQSLQYFIYFLQDECDRNHYISRATLEWWLNEHCRAVERVFQGVLVLFICLFYDKTKFWFTMRIPIIAQGVSTLSLIGYICTKTIIFQK